MDFLIKKLALTAFSGRKELREDKHRVLARIACPHLAHRTTQSQQKTALFPHL